MSTRKAFLLGGSSHHEELEALLAAQSFKMQRPGPKNLGSVLKSATEHRHLLLVDLDLPRPSGAELVERIKKAAAAPAPLVFLSSTAHFAEHEKALEPLLAQPDVDWVRTPIDGIEFRLRVSRVTSRRHGSSAPDGRVKATAVPVETWSMPSLRSERSGRLDATRIAQHFGWSLSDLSRGLHRSVQAVHKTPDAKSLQSKLEPLEQVALLARRIVTDNPAALRKWLNTPSRDLDKERPGALLLSKPAVVLQWLEDAALGHPA